MLTFTNHWAALALFLLPLVMWAGRHRMHGNVPVFGPSQRILRVLALTALVAAIMQPQWWRSVSRSTTAVVVDVSRSMAGRGVAAAEHWMKSSDVRAGAGGARIVVFAGGPTVLGEDESPIAFGAAGRDIVADPGTTDIERALDASRTILPADSCPNVVLFSDGNETVGQAWRAADRLRREGVVLHTQAVEPGAARPLRILGVSLPPGPRKNESMPMVVRVHSATAGSAVLEVSLNGGPASGLPVTLQPGLNEWTVPVTIARQGANELSIGVVSSRGTDGGSDRWVEAFTAGPGVRVLLEGRDPREMMSIAVALRQHGIQVRTRSPADDALPDRLGEVADVVVLVDSGDPVVPPAMFGRLETFVRDGGGLVFVAGENSNGEAAKSAVSLERILPVRFEARRRKRDMDLVMLVDRSFSMRGMPLEQAKSAILSVVDMLEPHHRFGVTAFDARPHEIVPLRPAGARADADDRVSRIVAGGQTNIHNALWQVLRQLRDSRARTRHVILLSDGNTAPVGVRPPDPRVASVAALQESGVADAGPPASFEDMASLLRQARISVSTVAIGGDADLELLGNLARWTGGQAYVSRRDDEVPELFVRDVTRLTGGSLLERPFRPVVREADAATDGLDFSRAPPLLGYALARAKRHARVLLDARPGHPLLVTHRYGLGTATAFLSDAHAHWSAEWLDWPGYGRFWAQVMRAAAPSWEDGRRRLSVWREGRDAIVRLDSLDARGAFSNAEHPSVSMSGGGREPRQVALVQNGPGRYEARVALEPSAIPYRFALSGTGEGIAKHDAVRSVFYPRADEDEGLAADRPMLEGIARHAGGAPSAPSAEVLASCRSDRRTAVELWPACSALALGLYLLEIGLRRFGGAERASRRGGGRHG